MKYAPHPYQRTAIKFGVERRAAAFWLDPGLGKTSISLAIMKVLLAKRFVKGWLVIAPLHVCYNSWPGEVGKWDDFGKLKYEILHGKDKLKALQRDADFYLINPEGLPWLFTQLHALYKGYSTKWPFDALVIDESSKFKHSNTQRFKLLRQYIQCFKRVYELTGSPAANGLENVWSQIFLLDQGKALEPYITHYRNKYFDQTGYGGYTYSLKKGADKLIHRKLDGLVLRMDAKDWLDLPPLVMNDILVDLPDTARRHYTNVETQFLTEVLDGTVTASNTAVSQMKCQQIANGAVFLDDDWEKDSERREWETVHDAKLDALEDLVDEQSGQPLLVGYWFHHDKERILKRFPRARAITGNAQRSAETIKAWNRGEVSLLLAQPVSAAWGLNLQGTHAAICFFSMLWDLEAYDQFIRRIWRQGQQFTVICHRIMAKDTIDDEVMAKALVRKDKAQGRLFDAMKALALRRGIRVSQNSVQRKKMRV